MEFYELIQDIQKFANPSKTGSRKFLRNQYFLRFIYKKVIIKKKYADVHQCIELLTAVSGLNKMTGPLYQAKTSKHECDKMATTNEKKK